MSISLSVEAAVDRLVDALLDAVLGALRSKGFHPSDKFAEELADLIRSHVSLGR